MAELRVLRTGAAHPHFNMALDEVLLVGAEERPTLRLYAWTPAGVSLGRFQDAAAFRDVPGDPVLVRRITGGGAIYHSDEITFSLALPERLLPDPVPESADRIHGGVAKALATIGVAARRPDYRCLPGRPRPEHAWCFADPIGADLLSASGKKLVGSAQRRVRRPTPRILHHGSLVLGAPPEPAECGSVAESVDPASVRAALEDALATQIATALGLRPRPGEPTHAELHRANELSADYADLAPRRGAS